MATVMPSRTCGPSSHLTLKMRTSDAGGVIPPLPDRYLLPLAFQLVTFETFQLFSSFLFFFTAV